MSRTDNESRSSRPGGELNGARAEPFRILRLYSIEKKDPKKPGPPKKSLQLTLEHLPADMAALLREQIEAQLRPQQALEVDGVLAIQETIELQGALRAVFEGETIRTSPKAGAPKPDEEEGFNIRNIKDWVAGLSTLKDVVSEVSKVAKDLKDMKSSQPAGASDGSQA